LTKYILIIVVYFIIFSLCFTFLSPPFEAPDENKHLSYVNYISFYKSLPDQYEGINNPEKYVPQGHQPPLYYVLLTGINFVANSGKPIKFSEIPNPEHYRNGGSKSHVPVYLHSISSPFESGQDKFMFYLFRVLSVLMGAATVFYIFLISGQIFGKKYVSLLPPLFAASLPQFAFVSSVINNDSLAILISTILFYYFIKISNSKEKIINYIVFGILAGVGIITKKTTAFVPVGALIALIISLITKKATVQTVKNSFVSFLLLILFGAFFFIRNILVYNEIFGTNMEISTMPFYYQPKNIFSYEFWNYFFITFLPKLTISFIAAFGWMNVGFVPENLTPEKINAEVFIYAGYLIIFLLTLFFIVRYSLISKLKDHKQNYLLLFFLLCFFSVTYFNTFFTQYQGRYMLPAISMISILIFYSVYKLRILTKLRSTDTKTQYPSGTVNGECCKISILIFILLMTLVIFFVVSDVVSILKIINFYHSANFPELPGQIVLSQSPDISHCQTFCFTT